MQRTHRCRKYQISTENDFLISHNNNNNSKSFCFFWCTNCFKSWRKMFFFFWSKSVTFNTNRRPSNERKTFFAFFTFVWKKHAKKSGYTKVVEKGEGVCCRKTRNEFGLFGCLSKCTLSFSFTKLSIQKQTCIRKMLNSLKV